MTDTTEVMSISEMTILYIGVVKLFLVLACAFLYSYAGRENTNKAWRRYVAPAILIIGTILLTLIHSQDWKVSLALLSGYPILVGAFSMGYSNRNGWGWLKRIIIALVVIASYCPVAYITSNWVMMIPVSLLSASTVIFGVFTPKKAATEELLIGFMFMLLYPFMGG